MCHLGFQTIDYSHVNDQDGCFGDVINTQGRHMYIALILISCYSLLRCCVDFRRDGLSEDGFKTDLRQVL